MLKVLNHGTGVCILYRVVILFTVICNNLYCDMISYYLLLVMLLQYISGYLITQYYLTLRPANGKLV